MQRFSIFMITVFCSLAIALILPQQCMGQDFVYQPKNPAFGGSPLNYQWLMSSANKQNKFKKSRGLGMSENPMDNFKQDLQRQILSELTQSIVQNKLGENFNFNKQSSLEFGNFSVDVNPSGEDVSLRIFDYQTGNETSITIPNINE